MVSWRSRYSPGYLLVLTHRVIGSSPVLCFFFLINHLSCFSISLIHFISYLLVLLITFGIIFFFIVLYFFFVIFTFEINSYYSIKFQKLNSACAAASLEQTASRLTVWIFSKNKESE